MAQAPSRILCLLSVRGFISPTLPASPVCLAISKYAPRSPQGPSQCYFQGHWLKSTVGTRARPDPSQHSHPRSRLMSLPLQPLAPDSAPEDPHLPQTHPTQTPSTVFWLSSHLPCPLQPAALFPGLPGSTLAFLMLMEVSTPGRKLKPPSSMKAGSSCPCTITLAPVTVDSSGMKSFCSVRSVRDRPGGAEGAEWGRSWRIVRGRKPPLPPA